MKKFFGIFFILLLLIPFVSGFTVTSVSSTNVLSNIEDISGEYWIINVLLDGGGQTIVGTLQPERVESLMGGEYWTNKPFSVQISALEEKINYRVINEGVRINMYEVHKIEPLRKNILGISTIVGNPPDCVSSDWDLPIGSSTWGYYQARFCVYKKQVGVKGSFDNPFIGFNAVIEVSNSDETIRKTICSGDSNNCDGSSVFFDNVGSVSWSGNLVTGEAHPNQNNFVAIRNLNSNRWSIARKTTYYEYMTKPAVVDSDLNSLAYYQLQNYDVDTAEYRINQIIQSVNIAANNLIREDVSFTSNHFDKNPDTGEVSVSLNRRLLSPSLVFRISASWLGVYIPVGEPKILKADSKEFNSGEKGEIILTILNEGDAQGTFSATLVGCDPFTQISSAITNRITLNPGEIDDIRILVDSGIITKDLDKQCIVKVYDVNNPEIITQSNIFIKAKSSLICIPGNYYSDGSSIKRCDSTGMYIENIDSCDFGVMVRDDGVHLCRPSLVQIRDSGCSTDVDCDRFSYCNQDINICVQKSGCQPVVFNGFESTINVVFVGDGYEDSNELYSLVMEIIDLDGNKEGMMSFEPFKSYKENFNFWMVPSKSLPASGWSGGPDRFESLRLAADCPVVDNVAVLSKKFFRSYAYMFSTPGDSYNSIPSTSTPGKLFLHEFGHSFGHLADEYVESSKGSRLPEGIPNCASDVYTALTMWGHIEGTSFYQGCSYIEGNIRPTFNSIMRNHRLADSFGPVNEKALIKRIEEYIR